LDLIDAGMVRPISQKYEWETDKSSQEVLLRPVRRSRRQAAKGDTLVPQFIKLTPETIAFMGAYDGDGNKTNNIGFAQNNPQLQEFVSKLLRVLFGDSFSSEVTILEDEKYFQGASIIEQMKSIKREWQNKGIPETQITERKLQEEVLQQRYASQYSGNLPNERIRFVISPRKGAGEPGKSSYEIIRNQLNSRLFLPFLLAIIKECANTIIEGAVGGDEFTWFSSPPTYHRQCLDIKSYIQSGRCCYVTASGNVRQYEICAEQGHLLWIRKPNGSKFAVPIELPLSPILCLMLGYYLAEGSSSKSAYFTFRSDGFSSC